MSANLRSADIYTAFVATARGPLKRHLKLLLAVIFTFALQLSLLVYVGLGFRPRSAERIDSDNHGRTLREPTVWMLVALCKVAGLSALAMFTQAEAQAAVNLYEEVLDRLHPTVGHSPQCTKHSICMTQSATDTSADSGMRCNHITVNSTNLGAQDARDRRARSISCKSPPDTRTRNNSLSGQFNRSGWLLLPPLMQMSIAAITMFLQGLVFGTYYPSVTWYYKVSGTGTIHGIILSCLALSFILRLDDQAWTLMQAAYQKNDVRSLVSFSSCSTVALLPLSWLRWLFRCCKQGGGNAARSTSGTIFNELQVTTAAPERSPVSRAQQFVCHVLCNLVVFLFHIAVFVHTTAYATFLLQYVTEHTPTYSLLRSPLAAATVLCALLCFMGFQTLAGLQIKPPRLFTSKLDSDSTVCCTCQKHCLLVSGQGRAASSTSSTEMPAVQIEIDMPAVHIETGVAVDAEHCNFCIAYCWVVNIALPVTLAVAITIFTTKFMNALDTCIYPYLTESDAEKRSALIMQCAMRKKGFQCPHTYWTDSKSYSDVLVAFDDCTYFWVSIVPLLMLVGASSLCVVAFGCVKHKCNARE